MKSQEQFSKDSHESDRVFNLESRDEVRDFLAQGTSEILDLLEVSNLSENIQLLVKEFFEKINTGILDDELVERCWVSFNNAEIKKYNDEHDDDNWSDDLIIRVRSADGVYDKAAAGLYLADQFREEFMGLSRWQNVHPSYVEEIRNEFDEIYKEILKTFNIENGEKKYSLKH